MPCIHTTGPANIQRACKPTRENPTICAHRGLAHGSHIVRCAIQWIDEVGCPTPDYNEAIGIVYMEREVDPITGYEMPESDHFPICEEHKRKLDQMRTRRWKYIPLAQYAPPEDP